MPKEIFYEYYETIKLKLDILERLEINLRKSIYRIFSTEYIENKNKISIEIIREVFKIINIIQTKFKLTEPIAKKT
jgi:hypothetical protein